MPENNPSAYKTTFSKNPRYTGRKKTSAPFPPNVEGYSRAGRNKASDHNAKGMSHKPSEKMGY